MPKRRQLHEELHIGRVDDDELTIVLSGVLPRGAQFRPNEVEYRTMNDEWALTLEYRDDKIVEAYAGPALTPELQEQVQSAITRDILVAAGRKIWRWTAFSSPRRVDGWWRHRDGFQILPVPPSAPQARELFADHPFILDVAFDDSPNFLIRQSRYSRKAIEVCLLLSVALRIGITWLSSRPRKYWVWAPEGFDQACIWAGEGYIIPGFNHLVDNLPRLDETSSLPEVPAALYYDLWAHRPDMLTIPIELSRIIDCFERLRQPVKDRFLRACHWYRLAPIMWDYSQSLYLTSLVNAIECLASVGPERHIPEGPTGLFMNFMKKYAPGAPSRNRLERIYDTRSKVTHGERLLSLDLPTQAWGLSQGSSRDREVGDDATILCRGALLNWLWSQGAHIETPLVTSGLRVTKSPKPGTKSGVQVILPDR
jgi:hypothetical protein